ncbi:hypothetical protein RHGRI_010114 [Rhododendron griersonianum]|uniref:Uncharacterized protein n=1 Tax=Rhododendron griersonianum TaxID=479676 RepID=A0AAV6KIF2_9ERIC|nr:hypothetical protein RHGRI_010114 [Rhododendron griersonianum]
MTTSRSRRHWGSYWRSSGGSATWRCSSLKVAVVGSGREGCCSLTRGCCCLDRRRRRRRVRTDLCVYIFYIYMGYIYLVGEVEG